MRHTQRSTKSKIGSAPKQHNFSQVQRFLDSLSHGLRIPQLHPSRDNGDHKMIHKFLMLLLLHAFIYASYAHPISKSISESISIEDDDDDHHHRQVSRGRGFQKRYGKKSAKIKVVTNKKSKKNSSVSKASKSKASKKKKKPGVHADNRLKLNRPTPPPQVIAAPVSQPTQSSQPVMARGNGNINFDSPVWSSFMSSIGFPSTPNQSQPDPTLEPTRTPVRLSTPLPSSNPSDTTQFDSDASLSPSISVVGGNNLAGLDVSSSPSAMEEEDNIVLPNGDYDSDASATPTSAPTSHPTTTIPPLLMATNEPTAMLDMDIESAAPTILDSQEPSKDPSSDGSNSIPTQTSTSSRPILNRPSPTLTSTSSRPILNRPSGLRS
jgi:hypothetical protein